MDTAWSRFKRTLTFRRKKKSDSENVAATSADGGKPHQWLEDEKKVREGTCSFQVKYLGNIEVTESRGMNVCEEAIKKLKSRTRGKQQRAILYVSGDAIRVVDEITKLKSPTEQKGLIVDQTIEKVSFCSPDRNHEKAFAYICRDGTTRRWLCHGFLAVRDSGERLSHAVGCAFAVCLERKQQRERDCAVKAEFSDSRGTTFTRVGSFRAATLTEKLLDPQISQIVEPPAPLAPPSSSIDDTAITTRAIPRPRASEDLMYRRFASMRLPSSASAYDYSTVTSATPTSTAASAGPAAWTVPSSASANQFTPSNNQLLLPPPPVSQASNFRRSASLRLDGTTAASIVARRPIVPLSTSSQFCAPNQISSSLSTSSQLGTSGGMLAFPRSSSAQAGFSTPIYGNIPSSVPPSIPEEDPWTSPPHSNHQVAAAADAVTQLCEQLTAGLLASPSNSAASSKINNSYSTVPQVNNVQNITPLKVMTSPPAVVGTASPVGPTSPFGVPNSAPSARNPFLATSNVKSTPIAASLPAAGYAPPVAPRYGYAPVPVVTPTTTASYFPAPSQWQAFPNNSSGSLSAVASPPQQYHSLQQQQIQPASLPWPSSPATNDPFAPTTVVNVPPAATTGSNPFKDAPFIANI